MRRRAIVLCLIVLLLVPSLVFPSRPQTALAARPIQITELPPLPGGTFSTVHAMNNLGQVVGSSNDANFGYHSVLWQGGTVVDLGRDFTPYAIDDNSRIVGRMVVAGGRSHAALLFNGTLTDLGSLPGHTDSVALAINSQGQIAGVSWIGDGSGFVSAQNAVFWDRGTITALPALSGGYETSSAYDINDEGHVVGSAKVGYDGRDRAVLWRDGTIIDLGVNADASVASHAAAINNRGEIVGGFYHALGLYQQRPFLWQGGRASPLPTLPDDTRDYCPSEINAHGQMVGTIACSFLGTRAVLWQQGTIVELGTLLPPGSGWSLSEANGINDRGQIIGQGEFGGRQVAYLLTLPQATLTVSANIPGGTVSLPSGDYPIGGVVSVTATPDPGQLFLGWQIAGSAATQTAASTSVQNWTNPLRLTLTADTTVTPIFAPRPAFGDMPPGDPAAEAIAHLAVRGVIRGCDPDGTPPSFCPGDITLRHQMAALIVRAMPGWAGEAHQHTFTDPTADAELMGRVGVLQHHGVVNGYQAASCVAQGKTPPCYGPLDPVLRAQAISFVTRAMVKKGYWVDQPVNSNLYGGALVGTGHEQDAATYWHYTRALGGVPDYPEGGAFPVGEAAPRDWFARLLWTALDSYFGH